MRKELSEAQKIEQSINKKFKKQLWSPFLRAIKTYDLIQPNDRIAVCISGGKDSMVMAVLFRMLMRMSDIPFTVHYLIMDPGYAPANRRRIEENLKRLGIEATIFETNVFRVADNQSKNPCYLCARMRRGHLYNSARSLNCNKIALGHHLNDAIETVLMSMFYSSKIETMIPKSISENFEGMELIRPLYCIKEEDILHWANYNDLHFLNCACSLTDRANNDDPSTSKRLETKLLIKELKKSNPEIEHNIFKALHAVQLNTFPGYKIKKEAHSFLEDYDQANIKKK